MNYTGTFLNKNAYNKLCFDRGSRPQLLLEKTVLKIFEKIPGLQQLQSSGSYSLMGSIFCKSSTPSLILPRIFLKFSYQQCGISLTDRF